MTAMDIAQGFGWMAALVGVLSFQARSRETVVFLLALSCLLWTIHYIGLDAAAGAIFNFIAMLRGLTALIRHPIVRKSVLLFIPLIWTVAVLTAKTPADYIPAIAMTMSTLAQASSQVLRLRLFMGLSGPPWLTYAALSNSHGGIANELLNIASNGIALYRYHLRPWLAERRRARSA